MAQQSWVAHKGAKASWETAAHLHEHHEAHTLSIQHRAAVCAVDAALDWLLLLLQGLADVCMGLWRV